MAFVYEFLVLFACAVGFVQGEVMVRVVAPAEVSVEFLDRHQLNCVDTKSLQIIQLSLGARQILGL